MRPVLGPAEVCMRADGRAPSAGAVCAGMVATLGPGGQR